MIYSCRSTTPDSGRAVEVDPARCRGFTILELLIVIAVTALLLTIGLPSFMDTIGRVSVNSASRSVASALNLARSEAVKRGETVSVCPSADGVDCAVNQWSAGWLVFVDNNGDADGSGGSVDAADEVIRVFEPLSSMVLSATTNLLQYDSQGYAKNASAETFKICPDDNDSSNAASIEVSLSGRARLLSTAVVCP